MKKITSRQEPVRLEDFQASARAAAADGKIDRKERDALTKAFKGLDRDGQIQGTEFLKSESPVLATFAKNNGAVHFAGYKRVGGDLTLDQFNASKDRAADRGFTAWERSSLAKDFRALSKADQATALSQLDAAGQKDLKEALEKSIAAQPEVKDAGTKTRADFDALFAKATQPNANGKAPIGEGIRLLDRGKLIETFQKMNVADQDAVVRDLKNRFPRFALSLDQVLNPRPQLPKPGFSAVV